MWYTFKFGRKTVPFFTLFVALLFLLLLIFTMTRPEGGGLQVAQAAPYSAAPLDVVLNEIAWMGTTTSFNDEWIELYNPTGSAINLTGWTLTAVDGTPTIALSGAIPAGGYYLLERTDDTTVPAVPADMIYTGSLGNTGEYLILRDELANSIDELDNSSGWVSGHSAAYVPMVRIDASQPANLADNWTYNPRCGSPTNSAGVSYSCVLTQTTVGSSLQYSVYFNPLATTASVTTTAQTPMETALLNLINSATSSIDIALYGLNRQSIVDALLAAHNRGVTVRVVGDDDAAMLSYTPWYQALISGGITVVIDASGYIQHNKFLVVDGEKVWTGSTNYTDTGFTLNSNNAILITDTTLAAIYTIEFEEMWGGTFHGSKVDNTAHLLDYNGTLVESYFSPSDNVGFEVWNELAAADESVYFAMFFWTDNVLSQRAIDLAEAGVPVFGVFDQLGEAGNGSDAAAMCAAGAHIGVEDFAGKLHHKFAIIDVNGSDPVVILGSYNWTDSGAYQNDENTLIIHDAALAQAYYAEWQTIWAAIELANICNPPTVYLPVIIR